jgi:hypothetical protein
VNKKWVITTATTFLLGSMIFTTSAQAAIAGKTVKGPKGQTLTVSTTTVKDGQKVKVVGKKFNRKIGIYLAFCVVNAKGEMPGPCGGGVNTVGESTGSIWISSNPPAYGKSLAKPFNKSGGFSQTVTISRYIGNVDCTVVRCAVVTRADHTNSSNRKADVIVPIKFKK